MSEPISIEEARSQLRLDGDASRDADLARHIRDAREWVERYTGWTLVARDLTEAFRAPPRAVELKAWPLASGVTVTADIDGVVTAATINGTVRPARVSAAAPARCWPMSSPTSELRITVRAGVETPDDVPGNMRRAMLLLIGAYEADREGGDLFAAAEARARSLCGSYRMRRL